MMMSVTICPDRAGTFFAVHYAHVQQKNNTSSVISDNNKHTRSPFRRSVVARSMLSF